MTKVSVKTTDAAPLVDTPFWLSGACRVWSYCGGAQVPIELDVVQPDASKTLRITGGAAERLGYVWDGEIEAGGVSLRKGSSFIVERGAALDILARTGDTRLALFSASRAGPNARNGGHVHLLPVEEVPRIGASASAAGTSGGLHANGKCETCSVWLNENSLPGQAERPAPEVAIKGTHAHPEDEIIFVTEGQLRLGAKLFPRGTALIIAADTLYSFAPGPEGVSFITFRPSGTTQIRFATGGDYKPSTFFDQVKTIPYRTPQPAHAA